jgi:hypothetical protein
MSRSTVEVEVGVAIRSAVVANSSRGVVPGCVPRLRAKTCTCARNGKNWRRKICRGSGDVDISMLQTQQRHMLQGRVREAALEISGSRTAVGGGSVP